MIGQRIPDRDVGVRAAEECHRVFGAYFNITNTFKKLGIEQKAYYRWYKGDTSPSARALQKLAFAGADVVYILTGKRTNEKENE